MEAMAPTAPAAPAATPAAQPRRVQDLCGATSAKARRLDPDSDEEDGRRFLYMDYAVPAPPVHAEGAPAAAGGGGGGGKKRAAKGGKKKRAAERVVGHPAEFDAKAGVYKVSTDGVCATAHVSQCARGSTPLAVRTQRASHPEPFPFTNIRHVRGTSAIPAAARRRLPARPGPGVSLAGAQP